MSNNSAGIFFMSVEGWHYIACVTLRIVKKLINNAIHTHTHNTEHTHMCKTINQFQTH